MDACNFYVLIKYIFMSKKCNFINLYIIYFDHVDHRKKTLNFKN